VHRGDWPILAAIGAGDVGANAAFAVASTSGLLSVVAVLSSLYPAVTVVLARGLHGERMRPVQSAGVGAALVGVVLIASGGGVSA
jgi:drug/metabolite transporter (DMT)-like permease